MFYRPHVLSTLVVLVAVALCGDSHAQSQSPLEPMRSSEEAVLERCGVHSVRGLYSTAYEGTAFHEDGGVVTAVPAVFLGQMSIDPASGTITGGGTVSVGGEVMDLEYVNSYVEVASDCTARATYFLVLEGSPGPAPTPLVERWVIEDGGDRIKAIIEQFPFARHATLGVFERLTPTLRTVEW